MKTYSWRMALQKCSIIFFFLFFCAPVFADSHNIDPNTGLPIENVSSGSRIPLPPHEDTGLSPFTEFASDNIRDDVDGTRKGHLILGDALDAVTDVIKKFLGIIGIAILIYSAVLLVTGGDDEDTIGRGKRSVLWGTLALVMALMVDTIIIDILYGGRDFRAGGVFSTVNNPEDIPNDTENIAVSIDAGVKLTLDAINWFKGVVIIGAVGFLIFSGVRMITALGESEEITKQKTVFLWIGLGIIVILLNNVIIQEVLYPRILGDDFHVQYSPNSTRGISEFVSLVRYFLQFLAVIAFSVFIYGGALMVSAFGDEEQIENAKKIITGAAIGIVVILMSFVVVSTFIGGQVSSVS